VQAGWHPADKHAGTTCRPPEGAEADQRGPSALGRALISSGQRARRGPQGSSSGRPRQGRQRRTRHTRPSATVSAGVPARRRPATAEGIGPASRNSVQPDSCRRCNQPRQIRPAERSPETAAGCRSPASWIRATQREVAAREFPARKGDHEACAEQLAPSVGRGLGVPCVGGWGTRALVRSRSAGGFERKVFRGVKHDHGKTPGWPVGARISQLELGTEFIVDEIRPETYGAGGAAGALEG